MSDSQVEMLKHPEVLALKALRLFHKLEIRRIDERLREYGKEHGLVIPVEK